MRYQEIREALRNQPFQPFRIRLTTGQTYDVRHPEFAWPTRTSLFVGILSDGEGEPVPDIAVQCDLLHIVAIEPIRGAGRHRGTRRRRPR